MPLIAVVYQRVKHIGFYAAFDLQPDGIGLMFNASIYPCRSRYIPQKCASRGDRRIVERFRHSFATSWGGTPNTFLNALVKLEGW